VLVELTNGEREILVKGAPDRILGLCDTYYHENATIRWMSTALRISSRRWPPVRKKVSA